MTRADLAKIEEIKEDATAARNLKQWGDALAFLDQVIEILQSLRAKVGDQESDAREIRSQLADAYGMKGGTYRRMSEFRHALDQYKQGAALERIDKLSTYNASNVITLGIALGDQSPQDSQIQEDLDRVIAELENATDGRRGDEWWAWSDLGQFYLLRGRPAEAHEAYRRAIKTAPTADELDRHCQILEGLKKATEASSPSISANIKEALEYLKR